MTDLTAWLLGFAASIADFAVYHPLWFVHRAGPLSAIVEDFPHVVAWYQRMRQIVQPPHADMTPEAALMHAHDDPPQELEADLYVDTHGISLGEPVTVTPVDTGCDPVQGELVLSMRDEVAIRRVDDRAGELIVHFPRIGYALKRTG